MFCQLRFHEGFSCAVSNFHRRSKCFWLTSVICKIKNPLHIFLGFQVVCCKISKFLKLIAHFFHDNKLLLLLFCFRFNGLLPTCCRLSARSVYTESLCITGGCVFRLIIFFRFCYFRLIFYWLAYNVALALYRK